jgi:hypothetical protein
MNKVVEFITLQMEENKVLEQWKQIFRGSNLWILVCAIVASSWFKM